MFYGICSVCGPSGVLRLCAVRVGRGVFRDERGVWCVLRSVEGCEWGRPIVCVVVCVGVW